MTTLDFEQLLVAYLNGFCTNESLAAYADKLILEGDNDPLLLSLSLASSLKDKDVISLLFTRIPNENNTNGRDFLLGVFHHLYDGGKLDYDQLLEYLAAQVGSSDIEEFSEIYFALQDRDLVNGGFLPFADHKISILKFISAYQPLYSSSNIKWAMIV